MEILGAAVATAVTEGSPPLGALRGEVDGLGLALGTAVAAVFAYGLARGRARRRGRRGIAFLAGWGLLAVALWSPLHALGHVSFTLHMVQHVVLVAMVPPLLLQAEVGALTRWR